jgi:hypothetical protein
LPVNRKGISDSEGNLMIMMPTKKGANIQIKINRRTWKDAIALLNRYTKEIRETAKQIKADPIEVWKEEQRRIKMIAEEKRLASTS